MGKMWSKLPMGDCLIQWKFLRLQKLVLNNNMNSFIIWLMHVNSFICACSYILKSLSHVYELNIITQKHDLFRASLLQK